MDHRAFSSMMVPDQLFGEGQVLQGNFLYQLPQIPLTGLFLHPVHPVHNRRIDDFAPVALETDSLAGDDGFVSLFNDYTEDAVVDYLLNPRRTTAPFRKKITSSIQYPNPEIPNRVGQTRIIGHIPTFSDCVVSHKTGPVNVMCRSHGDFVTLHNCRRAFLVVSVSVRLPQSPKPPFVCRNPPAAW